ncbi:MAG: TonB-dependent receptor, partial [Rhizobiales bacterium]|nr:TonB-dependent receptor [Rhizobacter sp.]
QLLIQNQQAASVGDVLQNDPAVRVARGFGNYQQLYIVRGLPVYSDDMSYNGLYGLLPRQYLAAELIERVEVLRGASAFLNGAAPGGSGLGGAINVMPKRAPSEPLNEVTLGVETGGQGYAAADIARRFGPDQSVGIRLNAVRRDGDTAVDGEQRALSVVSLGGDFRTGNLRVSADLGYQDHKLTASTPSITIAAGLAIPVAPDADKAIAQPWTYSNERDTFGTLRAEYDIATNLTGWLAGGFRRGEEEAVFANPTVTAADGSSNTYRFDNARRDSVATGEIGLRGNFRTGGVGHTLVASMALYGDKSKNAYGLSNFGLAVGSIYDPVFIAAPASNVFTGGQLDQPLVTARTKTSSLAIADTLSFADDRVLLTLGARRQKIESYSYDYGSGLETAAYAQSKVTPIGGVVFRASKQVSVYATYIEGLVKGDTAPATSGAVPVANAGDVFAPYQTRQTELGVKVDTGRFGGVFSVFQARKPIYAVDPTTLVFAQTDRQRNRGAELSVFGEAMPGLKLLGGASFLNTDVSGKDAIGAPKSQFNLGAEWDVPGAPGLALDARVVHTASQYADDANTQVVPSWSRLDLGARYAFEIGRQQLTVRARVDNATDRSDWVSVGGYPGSGYLVLGAPRTFVVSGTLSF